MKDIQSFVASVQNTLRPLYVALLYIAYLLDLPLATLISRWAIDCPILSSTANKPTNMLTVHHQGHIHTLAKISACLNIPLKKQKVHALMRLDYWHNKRAP